ncbi:uncharacterized protein LOC110455569 [Mizuhopecten yessoensis]|uniref:uncharacterized protein LOC110455569 n=1 Tax=Mizuhopecten yessoensis TaxID=6573 RepID=UPI000B457F7F|nr:uncharacterized protein LOC110455569 [Mizuhopecten yessoensis]
MEKYEDVFTDQPGRTNLAEHDIHTTTNDPVRIKSYPLPYNTKEVIKEEKAALTVKPSKCSFGFGSLPCLGHVVGSKRLQMDQAKVKAIRQAPKPTTKQQVRSFLGQLAGFYRRFIPNFAAIAVPLTDLTKKGSANHVQWEDSHERAYTTLKKMLIAEPV